MVDCIVVMGVSGSGKSTVAVRLAAALRWDFAEADAFHSATNIAKMSAGQPLTTDDRNPWLDDIATWLDRTHEQGMHAVLACSALRREYRDRLRGESRNTAFVHLVADPMFIADRVASREQHFMPASLVQSQFAILEPLQHGEIGLTLDAGDDADRVVSLVLDRLRPLAGPMRTSA